MKTKKHLISTKTAAIIVVAVMLFGLITYSIYTYYERTEETGEREFFCAGEECFVTMHIHSDFEFDLCGEDFELGREEAALEDTHTHKERNLMHWHSPLPADPDTQEILDYSNLTLKSTLAGFGKVLNSTCFEHWCNGNTCNNVPGKLSVYVNNELANESYVWNDGDKILIKFE